MQEMRSDVLSLFKEAEAEEATWTQIKIFNQTLWLKPNGQCYWDEGNTCCANLEEALQKTRLDALYVFQQGLSTYSRVIKDFDRVDSDRKYDEYFTEERISYFRRIIPVYQDSIEQIKNGKFLASCGRGFDAQLFRQNITCSSVWVDEYNPLTLGKCICGEQLQYV